MKENRNKKLFLLGGSLAVLLAVFLLVPGGADYNIGYKNDGLQVNIPGRIDDSVAQTDFTLPVIYLYSYEIDKLMPLWQWTPDGPVMPLREESTVDVYVFDRDVNNLTDIPTSVYYSTSMKLRGRTSSYMQDKKPFSLEIRNYRTGESENRPFLRLDAESDFIFHAPYIDRSLVRNYIAYTLQRQLLDWAPECRLAEVFVAARGTEETDMTNYQGVYLITEKIKRGKNAINIGKFTTSPNPDRQFEEGGGYIFKRDAYEEGFDTAIRLEENSLGNSYSLVSPKAETATQEQVQTIFTEIETYENALYNGTYEEMAKYYDTEQFAKVFLLDEFLKNYEGMSSSTFYYRAKGGQLKVVQWDFDIGTGNVDYNRDYNNARGWYLFKRRYAQPFLQHEEFAQQVISVWRDLRSEGGLLSEENIDLLLDGAETQLAGAWQRNDAAWPQLFQGIPFGNSQANKAENSLEEREYIREFLRERGRWMDEHIEEITGLY